MLPEVGGSAAGGDEMSQKISVRNVVEILLQQVDFEDQVVWINGKPYSGEEAITEVLIEIAEQEDSR